MGRRAGLLLIWRDLALLSFLLWMTRNFLSRFRLFVLVDFLSFLIGKCKSSGECYDYSLFLLSFSFFSLLFTSII
jgi:hypothetical protein